MGTGLSGDRRLPRRGADHGDVEPIVVDVEPPRRRRRAARQSALAVAAALCLGLVAAVAVRAQIATEDAPSEPIPSASFGFGAQADTTSTTIATLPALYAAYVVPRGVGAVDGRVDAIRDELRVVSDWFATNTGGGHPRIAADALGPAPVRTVQLDLDPAELAAHPNPLEAVAPVVDRATGAEVYDVLLVYVEWARPGEACGEGTHNWLTAVVWIGTCNAMSPRPGAAFGEGATVIAAHEIVHALGGVAACEPNDDGAGHVTDDARDLMSKVVSPGTAIVLDANGDDYLHDDPDCSAITRHPAWEPPDH